MTSLTNSSIIRFYSLLVVTIFLLLQPSKVFSIQISNENIEQLRVVGDYICNRVSTDGEAKKLSVKGSIGLKSKSYVSSIVDFFASIIAEHTSEEYKNVLRQHLSTQLSKERDCRLEIWRGHKNLIVRKSPSLITTVKGAIQTKKEWQKFTLKLQRLEPSYKFFGVEVVEGFNDIIEVFINVLLDSEKTKTIDYDFFSPVYNEAENSLREMKTYTNRVPENEWKKGQLDFVRRFQELLNEMRTIHRDKNTKFNKKTILLYKHYFSYNTLCIMKRCPKPPK